MGPSPPLSWPLPGHPSGHTLRSDAITNTGSVRHWVCEEVSLGLRAPCPSRQDPQGGHGCNAEPQILGRPYPPGPPHLGRADGVVDACWAATF